MSLQYFWRCKSKSMQLEYIEYVRKSNMSYMYNCICLIDIMGKVVQACFIYKKLYIYLYIYAGT